MDAIVEPVQAKRSKWIVLVCVGIATFLSSLNSSLTSTILPTIERSLNTTTNQSEWLVLIYLLIMTVALIPIGRLSDHMGRRKLFLLGFVRGKALGFQALMTYIGLSLGPLIGGSIASLFGWQFTFFISVPFGAAGLILTLLVIKDGKDVNARAVDVRGMACFAVAMIAMTLLMNASSISGSHLMRPLLFAVMIAAFALFFHVEQEAPFPMIPLRLFRIRNFGFGAAGAVFNYLCFYLVLFLIPYYFDVVLHSSAMRTGFIFSITPVIMTICSPIVGAMSDRFGSRVFSMTGMGFCVFSLILFGMMAKTSSAAAFALLILGLVCIGFGTGVFAAPNNSAIMGAAPKKDQGVASGVVATFRNIGMILGTTIGGSLFGYIQSRLSGNGFTVQETFLASFSVIMWIGAFFGAVGFLCAFHMEKKS